MNWYGKIRGEARALLDRRAVEIYRAEHPRYAWKYPFRQPWNVIARNPGVDDCYQLAFRQLVREGILDDLARVL